MKKGRNHSKDIQGKKKNRGLFSVSLLLFLITAAVVAGIGYFTHKSVEEFIRVTVLSIFAAGCFLFVFVRAVLEDSLLYDNREHLWRFFCIYLACLLLSVLYTMLPVAGWPFLVIGVALALFSNELIGILALTELLFITVSFAGVAEPIFLLYFLTSTIGAVLFTRLDEGFHAFYPALTSFAVLFTSQLAVIVLFMNERLNIGMLIMPVMNLFMNGILLMIALKYFSFAVIHKYREAYLEINDPECRLLADLKERSRASYYRCIHTAYLCERTAVRLGLDATVCKLGGYYFRLEEFCPAGKEEALTMLREEYHFPPNVLALLEECGDDVSRIQSREATVVLLADEMIKTLLYLFGKDKDTRLDYKNLVDTIIRKKNERGMFRHSRMSFVELEEVRSILIGEELYYDFLR